MSKPFYVTTPIYYVNDKPHIGHTYTTVLADVLARHHRMLGERVYFLTGTDEHGQKIEKTAAGRGITPQQLVDEVAPNFENLWQQMGLTVDHFVRTTHAAHKAVVQARFEELRAKGDIYKAEYEGLYSVSDEAFVTGTFGGLTPIRSVDGRDLPAALPGPLTQRLGALYAALKDSEAGVLSV